MRKKAVDLKKKPGYEIKEIKIMKDKLLVDNNAVDRNLFFILDYTQKEFFFFVEYKWN